MNYPFEFSELLITEGVLDDLGFSKYWAGCGDFGDRSLDLGGKVGALKNEYPRYIIREIDEKEDECDGYCGEPYKRVASHFATKDFYPMYFIHEMYEDILSRRTPEEVQAFIELCKSKNIYYYIESYLKWKNK